MCTAKNDEKEMLAQLVQNATEVKNEENNYTPVHFAPYLSRHKFPELLLKKTENVKRSKSLQKL
jgi:hypothetical protein